MCPRMLLSVLFFPVLLRRAMSIASRAARWLQMAEEARAIAERLRDPGAKQTMLEIANGYDELAAWTVNAVAADEGEPSG